MSPENNCPDSLENIDNKDFFNCDSLLLNEAIEHELELVHYEIPFITTNEEYKLKQECDTEQVMHKCSECSYKTSKERFLNSHKKRKHEDCPYVCYICKKGCKTKAALNYHTNTHLKVKPYRCNNCKASFSAKGDLVRHNKYKHTLDKPNKCTECNYISVEVSHMNRHMKIHTGEKPFQCQDCSYACSVGINLKRHELTHSGVKPFKCDICGSLFTLTNSLKEHQAKHVGDGPTNKCSLCPQLLGRKRDVIIHTKRWHFSEQPLPCKHCQQTFPDKYQLNKHMKNDNNHLYGSKAFTCGLCEYSCMSELRMLEHASIHKDTKPWKCSLCDQRYRQKGRLKLHHNKDHNASYMGPNKSPRIYLCSVCDISFAKEGNLKRHITQHQFVPELKESLQPSGDVKTKIYIQNTVSIAKSQKKKKVNKRRKLENEEKMDHQIKEQISTTHEEQEDNLDKFWQELITEDLEDGEIVD